MLDEPQVPEIHVRPGRTNPARRAPARTEVDLRIVRQKRNMTVGPEVEVIDVHHDRDHGEEKHKQGIVEGIGFLTIQKMDIESGHQPIGES